MKIIKVGDKQFELCESWDDVTLTQYQKITQVGKNTKDELSVFDVLLSDAKMLEIFANANDKDLNGLSMIVSRQLIEDIKQWCLSSPNYQMKSMIEIDGVHYSAPTDLNSLSGGEVMSMLDFISNRFNNDSIAASHYVLAILYRPSQKVIDAETKKEEWIRQPFDDNDLRNVEWRAELFQNRLKVPDFITSLSFFLDGIAKLLFNTQTYSNQETQEPQQITSDSLDTQSVPNTGG